MPSLEEKIDALTARAEITDVIGRYTYGMDSRDWALYRSCWTDEISVDFSDLPGYGGMTPAVLPADVWVDGMRALFEHMPHSQHLKVPVSFDIRGDEATVISLMQGKHFMPTDRGEPTQTTVGYYRSEFRKTPDGWRMSGLTELLYWNEGNSYVLDSNLDGTAEVLRAALAG